MARKRDPFVGGLESKESFAHRQRIHCLAVWDLGLKRRQEGPLEAGPYGEQLRAPLPGGIDARVGAVVQLVAEVESELQVIVAERLLHVDNKWGYVFGLRARRRGCRARQQTRDQL